MQKESSQTGQLKFTEMCDQKLQSQEHAKCQIIKHYFKILLLNKIDIESTFEDNLKRAHCKSN